MGKSASCKMSPDVVYAFKGSKKNKMDIITYKQGNKTRVIHNSLIHSKNFTNHQPVKIPGKNWSPTSYLLNSQKNGKKEGTTFDHCQEGQTRGSIIRQGHRRRDEFLK